MKGSSLARKAFHFSGVVIPVTYLLCDRTIALCFAGVLLSISVVVEWLRMKGHLRITLLEKHMKEQEATRPTGSFFFLVSSFATVLIFSKEAAVPALFVLSISDPFSSFIGYRLGRTPLAGKTVEGTVAFFLSAYIVLAFFPLKVHAVVAGAFAASLTELLSSRLIDDNLWIPIVTALVITLLT